MPEQESAPLGNIQLKDPIQPPAPPAKPPPGPGELGYVPPTDVVPLPSQGKVYSSDFPLHQQGVVEIRSMTARDEDILSSRALLKQGKAIGSLLQACIVNKSVDVEQLLVGDRNAILVAIRITGYGPEYEITVECPACEEKFKHEFNLATLEIKQLGSEPITIGSNAFGFVLPVSNKQVVFKLLTGADERELSQMHEKARKAGSSESLITMRLFAQIVTLGGESDRQKLAQIVRNLPAQDSRRLRQYIDKVSPGIIMKQSATCTKCGEDSEVEVPLGAEFFWPSAGEGA